MLIEIKNIREMPRDPTEPALVWVGRFLLIFIATVTEPKEESKRVSIVKVNR